MDLSTALFVLIGVLAFAFVMTNGILDGGGIVSTVIITRVLEPFPALCVMAVCEILGIFLLGDAVARTMGVNMIQLPASAPATQVLGVVMASIFGALVWNITMWRLSLPGASSHALIGGLLGAISQQFGLEAFNLNILIRVLAGLLLVPLVAMLIGLFLSKLVFWMGQFMTPSVGRVIRWSHVAALAGIALVHGSNGAQKGMAVVLLAMVATGAHLPAAGLPSWVGLLCGTALGIGVIFGSRRTIQTVGQGLFRVQSLHGLCAEATTVLLVGGSSLAGYPMATSQVMSSAIIGAGAAERPRAVRWDLAGNIGLAWLITIPAAAALSAFISYVVSKAI